MPMTPARWGSPGSLRRLRASLVHHVLVHPLMPVAELLDSTGLLVPRIVAAILTGIHNRTAQSVEDER